MRPARSDRWSLFLVLAMVLTAGYALAATHWAPGLGRVPAAAFAAALLGWILAHSRLRPRACAWLASAYGLTFLLWTLYQETQPLAEVEGLWLNMHVRTWAAFARLAEFLNRVYAGAPNNDLLIFTLSILWATWIISSIAAWSAFRVGGFWPAFLPSGVTLLAVAYFYNGPANERLYLGLYLFFGLLLLARFSLQEQTEDWRSHAVNFTGEVSYEFARMGLLATVVVLTVAWSASGRSVIQTLEQDSRVGRAWDSARETFTRMFGELQAAGPGPGDYYGQTLALGGAVDLSPSPVFQVTTSRAPDPGRFYWRAAAYDHYQDGRWELTASIGRDFDPRRDSLEPENSAGRIPVEAQFTVLTPSISRLYLLAEPVWIDRAAWIDSDPDGFSVVSARARALLPNRASYVVRSAVLRVDQTSLRNAGQAYSRWIRDNYLQLPSTITSRTRDLAHLIAGEEPTVYDKAEAITRYLRESIVYDTQIAPPPTESEPVDWLLFESPRGYCNYYASAEVILLRALGIPARLAVGFSQGESDASGQVYLVRESGAHAWPEVYFPNIGWVEFEPTAAEPELVRPEVIAAAPDLPQAASTEQPVEPRDPRQGNIPEDVTLGQGGVVGQRTALGWMLVAVPSVLLVSFAVWALVVFLRGDSPWYVARSIAARLRLAASPLAGSGPRRVSREAAADLERGPLSVVERAYVWICRLSDWQHIERGEHLTPLESVARVKQQLPDLGTSLDFIAHLYIRERYGAAPPVAGDDARHLAHATREVVRRALPLAPGHLILRAMEGLRTLRGRA
jgi:transglutaminase-like putative cysteine protease